jgi:hypothetical protein
MTVRAAFLALLDRWAGFNWDEPARRRNQDTREGQLLDALATGKLTAKVFTPEGVKELPMEAWSDWWSPQHVLFGDDIPPDFKDGWKPYAGHTPFLERSEFDAWLRRNTPAARRAAAVRCGYLTPDQALNWLMWQDHPGDTLLRSIEAAPPSNGVKPFMPLADAMAGLIGLLTSEEGFAVCTDAASGETIALSPFDFSDPQLIHADSGHVVTQKQHERQSLIARGHWNLLRVKADTLIDRLTPDNAEWDGNAIETPTSVMLEREAPFTDWITAAIWVGNGGKDGDGVPGDALENGTAAMLLALVEGKYAARGKFNAVTPDTEGHLYSRDVPAHLWEDAVMTDDPSLQRKRPRVYVRFPEKTETRGGDQDPGHLAVDFYLPDRLTPSFTALSIPTEALVAAHSAVHADNWVWEYQRSAGESGRGTPTPILIEKMRRRHAEGELLPHRPDEFEFLERWLRDPEGVPQSRGWEAVKAKSMNRSLADEYAKLSLTEKP